MPLNKNDRKFIENNPGRPVKELARELKAKEDEVQRYLNERGLAAEEAGESRFGLLGYSPAHPLGILFLVAVISVVYLNSVRNGFHYDDIHSLTLNLGVQVEWDKNPESRKLFLRYFTEPELFSSRPKVGMPRPLLMVTFALNYMWSRYEPWSWVVVNIIIHAINTLLIYVGLCHLTGRRRLALLTALLFAVHPANTETVNYINCRSESLGVMFMLLLIYFFTRALKTGRLDLRIAAFVSFVLGLLTKEMVFVTPATLAVIDYLFIHPVNGRQTPLAKRLLKYYLPLVLIWVLYFIYRRAVMDTFVVERTVRPISDNLVTQARVLLSYVRILFFPLHLNISYENIIYTVKDLEFPAGSGKTFGDVAMVYLAGLVLSAIATTGALLHRRLPLVTFVAANFFITLSITSVVPLNAIMNEHRLYLPSFGVCLLLAASLEYAANRLGGKAGGKAEAWPVPIQALSVAVFILFAALTVNRNFIWHTDLTVWKNSIVNSPEKAQVVSDLGNAYYRTGRDLDPRGDIPRDGTLDRKERMVIQQTFLQDVPEGKISPETSQVLRRLLVKGLNRAEQLYRWGIRVEANYYKAWHNLGTIYYTYAMLALDGRDIDKAKEYLINAYNYFLSAIEIAPTGESFNDAGSTLLQLMKLEEDPEKKKQLLIRIEELYKKGVYFNPELNKGFINLCRIQKDLGKLEEAAQNCRKGLQVNPLDLMGYEKLGEIQLQLGRCQEALEVSDACLKVDPNYSSCRTNRLRAEQCVRSQGR